MGLFSRKPKAHKDLGINTDARSTKGSFASDACAKSQQTSPLRMLHRQSGAGPTPTTSNGYTSSSQNGSVPTTPLTPFSTSIPKVDLPTPPRPDLDPSAYLRSLGAIRERCKVITDKAMLNELNHFDVDLGKFSDVVTFVCGIIKRDYDAPFTNIPSHGRYQHFCVGGRDRIANLLSTWGQTIDPNEQCRRLIDLFVISVLLDAGAGSSWSFKSGDNGKVYRRSEGLAIASFEMFKTGLFSGDPSNKHQVDKKGLHSLTVAQLAKAMQSGPGNEIDGLEGRCQLLINLADALELDTFWGPDGRPGHMVDYLVAHPTTQASSMPIVVLPVLWNLLMSGLDSIWPNTQTAIDGVSLGDAWPCAAMPQPLTSPVATTFSAFPNTGAGAAPWEAILPFHKLMQWLAYSVMQPMQSLLKIHFAGTELLSGLPEYRNGGLFIDTGVLVLKDEDAKRGLEHYRDWCRRTNTKPVEVAPMFDPSDDVVVEWRGVTVGFLDRLLVEVNKTLAGDLQGNQLTLAQLMEAGSWKGGREIAEVSRPNTREPPILIESDGSLL